MSKRTELEDALAFQVKLAKLPTPEREYKFHPSRRWRFDFAWPENHLRIAVEVEGAIFVGGRHNRGLGMLADMEKYNAATVLGWRLLRVGEPHIRTGQALEWIEELLEKAKAA